MTTQLAFQGIQMRWGFSRDLDKKTKKKAQTRQEDAWILLRMCIRECQKAYNNVASEQVNNVETVRRTFFGFMEQVDNAFLKYLSSNISRNKYKEALENLYQYILKISKKV